MKLSILIASLEDYTETVNTIQSIRDTCGDRVEIVVVDDGTRVPVVVHDQDVVLIRNEERSGVGAARHIAALKATGTHFLIVDSHMRFESGWLDKAIERIKDRPYTVHCATCVGLTPDNMNMHSVATWYSGATINFAGPDKHQPDVMQFMEGVWLPQTTEDDVALPCVMGACYFVPAEWFFHIGGLRLLRGWGSDEPFLSLKTWLAGGDCRLLANVRIGHQFRKKAHYETEVWKLWYNRMLVALLCLPADEGWKLCRMMGGDENVALARKRIRDDMHIVLSERAYLQSIFRRSFTWYLSRFKLNFPA